MEKIYAQALKALYPTWDGEIAVGGGGTLCGLQTLSGENPDIEAVRQYVTTNQTKLEVLVEIEELDKILPRHIEYLMDATSQEYHRELAQAKTRKEELRTIIKEN